MGMSPGPNNDEVVGELQQQQQQHQQEEIELQVYEVDLHHEAEPHHMSLEILDPLPVEGIVIPIVEHRKLVKDDMMMPLLSSVETKEEEKIGEEEKRNDKQTFRRDERREERKEVVERDSIMLSSTVDPIIIPSLVFETSPTTNKNNLHSMEENIDNETNKQDLKQDLKQENLKQDNLKQDNLKQDNLKQDNL